ncbi:MAG: DMT family transporter [Ardenticatenia bacterium]|nr:DMT family transporter [Ardenticatenia bacterium]
MDRRQVTGILFTLFSTVCAGTAPIFGKLAYQAQVTPYTLVALRTSLAALSLWGFYVLFWRHCIPIRGSALAGCVAMGVANGLGSLMYYPGLARIDASLAQLLYALYPVWVFVFLSAAGQPVSRLAVLRLGIAIVGVYLLTFTPGARFDFLGAMLLVAAGAAYGWHLVLGQWTLANVDSRTVALYTITTMAVVVDVARLSMGDPVEPISPLGWVAIAGLALIAMALARLLVFAGLSRLGGIQTSILSVGELVVALILAFLLLGERMTAMQWTGALLIGTSMLMIGRESNLELEGWEQWLAAEMKKEQ